MEQESDTIDAVNENGVIGASDEATTDEAQTSKAEFVARQEEDAPREHEEDRTAQNEEDRDAEDAITRPPVKRKSHRPSLEVVEVKVDSFYNKGDFKQDLQVKATRRKPVELSESCMLVSTSSIHTFILRSTSITCVRYCMIQ